MDAAQILDGQAIVVKRGRLNGLGFEPAFNSYFDFYISSKYIDPALIKLEDMGLHLYLRRNISDKNPQWKMPTIRQMMSKLGVSQRKLASMMERLEHAQLLRKESGYMKWADGRNIRNEYYLSDPIQNLEEFLAVAAEGVFGTSLRPEWARTRDAYERYAPELQGLIREEHTDLQTLKTEQSVWMNVLEQLKSTMPTTAFTVFLEGTELVSIIDEVATIQTNKPHSIDYIENRLSNRLIQLVETEYRILGEPKKIARIQLVFV